MTIAASLVSTAAGAETSTQHQACDVAAIETIVEAVANLADRGDFDALEKLYAPEVRVDYKALTGGEPEVKSAAALMTGWAAVLPGFDRTRHEVGNIKVRLNGTTASASADLVASHWLGDRRWVLRGGYDYGLQRENGGWRIVSHTLRVADETGPRDIGTAAAEAAKAKPADYTRRAATRAAVMRFLTGLETKDMAQVNAVWAEDAVQEMPYVPEGFPSRVVGREALIRQYQDWPKNSGCARFTDGIRFYPTQDPEIVFVEYRGVTEVVPTGRTYDQRYGGLFHVEDGKITLFREYFDPNVFARAFALGEGGRFGGNDTGDSQ